MKGYIVKVRNLNKLRTRVLRTLMFALLVFPSDLSLSVQLPVWQLSVVATVRLTIEQVLCQME